MIPALLLAGAQMGIGMWEQQQQAKSNRKLKKQLENSLNLLESTKGGVTSAFDIQEELATKEYSAQSEMFNQQVAQKHEEFTSTAGFQVGKAGFAGGGSAEEKLIRGTEGLGLETKRGQFALQSELFNKQNQLDLRKHKS